MAGSRRSSRWATFVNQVKLRELHITLQSCGASDKCWRRLDIDSLGVRQFAQHIEGWLGVQCVVNLIEHSQAHALPRGDGIQTGLLISLGALGAVALTLALTLALCIRKACGLAVVVLDTPASAVVDRLAAASIAAD